jgi:hypothetical protein
LAQSTKIEQSTSLFQRESPCSQRVRSIWPTFPSLSRISLGGVALCEYREGGGRRINTFRGCNRASLSPSLTRIRARTCRTIIFRGQHRSRISEDDFLSYLASFLSYPLAPRGINFHRGDFSRIIISSPSPGFVKPNLLSFLSGKRP